MCAGTMYSGNHALNRCTHRADFGGDLRVIGVAGALLAPGSGQVEVGQRRSVLACAAVGAMKTASRVPG